MRVITGKFKGKKLTAVKGLKIRPTSDKLKAAIFNVLFSISGDSHIKDKAVLDLFAGSGAVGIEAISRGARECCFVDKDADSVNVIKRNLASVGINDEAHIIVNDFKKALYLLNKSSTKFDFIFIDPPYKKSLTLQAIKNINDNEVFNKDCIIVAEHCISEKLPEQVGGFNMVTEKLYGDKALSFYKSN